MAGKNLGKTQLYFFPVVTESKPGTFFFGKRGKNLSAEIYFRCLGSLKIPGKAH
jgi:hypothetical protein